MRPHVLKPAAPAHVGPIRLLSAAVLLSAASLLPAADAVGWRGDGTGLYPDARPPLHWGPDKNIVWKTPLPGTSHSGPIIVGERLFLLAQPAELLCVDARDGTPLWQASHTYAEIFDADKVAAIEAAHAEVKRLQQNVRMLKRSIDSQRSAGTASPAELARLEQEMAELQEQIPPLNLFPAPRADNNGNTTGCPTSDGSRVYAAFGTGIVSAHSLDGKRQWMRFIEAPSLNWGNSASPLLVGGLLIVHYRDLVALDPATGDEVWRTVLPARHGSPVAARAGDEELIVTPSGAIVRAADGQVLTKGLFGLGHSSPVVCEGTIFAMQDQVKAYPLPDDPGTLQTARPQPAWEAMGTRQRRFASPLYCAGVLYGVTELGILDAIDARTGKIVYRKRLDFGPGRVYPSPSAAGDYIFFSSDNGTTAIIRAGRQYEELARNELEPGSSNLVFDGNRLYARTKTHLYCIAEEGSSP